MARTIEHYLSGAAMFRDDADYLAEWIEFHLLMGVERFSLYNNGSTDDYEDVLDPYVRAGIAEVIDWPHPFPRSQMQAIDHCVESRREDSRWLAFLDVDEFLFSPTSRALPEVLEPFERWSGVAVNWRAFGPSGHVEKPNGLVIESYTRRAGERAPVMTRIKTIVQPSRVLRAETPHNFIYREGFAVDEELRPVGARQTESHSSKLLRINHYLTRSLAELRRKHDLWEHAEPPRDDTRPWEFLERMASRYDHTFDDEITMYVPALRRALARRRQ